MNCDKLPKLERAGGRGSRRAAADENARLRSSVALPVLLACLLLNGCNQDSGPTAQDLLRQRQLRESTKLSKPRTLEQQLARAGDQLANGNVVAAQETMRPLLISQPEHPDVIMLSARCEVAAGDPIAAAKMLESMDPSDVESYTEALWTSAQWLTDANAYDLAGQQLQRILQLRGDETRVHRKLATILNNQGRRIEAAKHLRALARSGDVRERELFAMYCYSEPFIDESVPKPEFGNQLALGMLMQARLYRVDGEMERARVLADRLAQAFPESTQISAFLGRVHADFHDDDALRDWVKLVPTGIEREPEYWHTLGVWLQRQGLHREAVRCLAEAVSRDPTDRIAYAALARSLQTLGQQDVAARVLARFELLTEFAEIIKLIGRRPGTLEELNRVSDILEILGRPYEAIAWRTIAVKQYGGTESQLAEVQQQRESLTASNQEADDGQAQAIRTCGIDVTAWPLPTADAIGTSIAAASRPPTGRSADFGPIVLREIAAEVGLNFQYDNGDDPSDDKELLHQLTGGGIGVIDLDRDGWSDLYFTQGGGDAYKPDDSQPNRLFRNLGGQRFLESTAQTQTGDQGYGQGVAVADINQDGFPDLLVANIGPNVLYANNGDGTFTQRPLPVVNPEGDWTTSIACGDLSGDHLPEIFEVNYVDDPTALTIPCTAEETSCVPIGFRPALDRVWSVGPEMSVSRWNGCVEIDAKPSYGFAAVIADIDGKLGNEVFIANDGKHNHYWIAAEDENTASRKLTESARIYGCDTGLLGEMFGCMGIAYGDFDRNSKPDLHVTNFWNQPADLYMQHPSGLFSNGNVSRGLYQESRETVGWGTQAIDLDRDGWLDLPVLNGHVHDYPDSRVPYKMRPQLFRGGAERFQSVDPGTLGDDYWSRPALGRTMAVLDWNADSRPDLVTNHLDVPAAVLENQTAAGNSLQVELVGTESERDAIGATVSARCGEQVWTGWAAGGDGFLCSNEAVVDFGIGPAETIDQLQVSWPSGRTQQFNDLPVNARVLIVEGEEEVFRRQTLRAQ